MKGTLRNDVRNAIDSDVYTNNATGAQVDTRGFEFAELLVNLGDLAGGATLSLQVRTATELGGTYADVPGASITVDTSQDSNTAKRAIVRLDGTERFLRVVSTQGGTGNCDWGAQFYLKNGQYGEEDGAIAFIAPVATES